MTPHPPRTRLYLLLLLLLYNTYRRKRNSPKIINTLLKKNNKFIIVSTKCVRYQLSCVLQFSFFISPQQFIIHTTRGLWKRKNKHNLFFNRYAVSLCAFVGHWFVRTKKNLESVSKRTSRTAIRLHNIYLELWFSRCPV